MTGFGLQVYDGAGQPNFSIKGRLPRYHSHGVFMVPRYGQGNYNINYGGYSENMQLVNIYVPDITNPAEWWIAECPSTSAAYSYIQNDLYIATISYQNVQLIVRIHNLDFPVPFKYILLGLK